MRSNHQSQPHYDRYNGHREQRLAYMREWRRKHRTNAATYEAARRDWKNGTKRQERFEENGVNINFVAFDGEGSHGLYQLFACSATDRYVAKKEGLSTLDSLGYIRDLCVDGTIGPYDALIGFGLTYDFENILRDVPDADYIALRLGERITYGPYLLRYINRKFLDITFRDDDNRLFSVRLQDIYPYFQQSFIKACEARGITLPDVVYEGKRNRSSFKWSNIEQIIAYNAAELVAMVQLANSLRDEFVAAFTMLDIAPTIGKVSWYGPGAQASTILNVAHPEELTTSYDDDFVAAVQKTFLTSYKDIALSSQGASIRDIRSAMVELGTAPFASAYFGGRIEAAMQGRFDQPLYDYDLTSAYPYAITRLPKIARHKMIRTHTLDPQERIGVYLVRWEWTHDAPFFPFPYRARGDNVYFPPSGRAWILSPEVYVAAEHFDFTIEDGYVVDGTEGYGRGLREGNSELASLMRQMGLHRAEAKAQGNPAHHGLKLLMNSIYGKTLQKEGSRKFFNVFVAAWITSVTRARIYALIANTRPGDVISIMTDGVLSTVPLSATLGSELGDWGLTMYDGGYQFAPGVYQLNCMCHGQDQSCSICGGKGYVVHYRGFLKFDAMKAAHCLDTGAIYETDNPVFVSRTMAMHNKDVAKKRYQFYPIKREENFSLSSKRNMESPMTIGMARYFPPKSEPQNIIGYVSWPYTIYTRRTLDKLLAEEREDDVE